MKNIPDLGHLLNNSSDMAWSKITRAVLAAVFFFGFAIIAMLPPFEGWDETAHFSRLQAQVFAPSASRLSPEKTVEDSTKRITMDVFDYYRQGPMPYQWIDFGELHAYDSLGGYTTYRDFFGQPARFAEYIRMYRESPLLAGYRPSPEPNWQYQHPALYYGLVSKALKVLTGHVSLVTSLFVLRAISWIMAFTGFYIGLRATRKYLAATGRADAAMLARRWVRFILSSCHGLFLGIQRGWGMTVCASLLFGIQWALISAPYPRAAWRDVALSWFLHGSWLVDEGADDPGFGRHSGFSDVASDPCGSATTGSAPRLVAATAENNGRYDAGWTAGLYHQLSAIWKFWFT